MRTVALAVLGIAFATGWGVNGGWANNKPGPVRTAAIHPDILNGNGNYDPRGTPLAARSITQDQVRPPQLARLTISRTGILVASGYGRPGQDFRLFHNDRVLADATVAPDGTWRLSPTRQLGPGNHHLLIETSALAPGQIDVGDELRISIPPNAKSTIDLKFDTDQRLSNYAQNLGEAASRVFDNFLAGKKEPSSGPQVAQRRSEARDHGGNPAGLVPGHTLDWLGSANQTYQEQIVPRLQLGGGLILPAPGQSQPPRAAMRLRRLEFPTIDGVTKTMQSWFGESADNFDGEILPRLSGARPPAIVLKPEPEREPLQPTAATPDQLAAARAERQQAEAQRRAAAEARQRAERERQRIEAEQKARDQRLAAARERRENDLAAKAEAQQKEQRQNEAAARLRRFQEAHLREKAKREAARERERQATEDQQKIQRAKAERQKAQQQRRIEIAKLPPAPQRNVWPRQAPRAATRQTETVETTDRPGRLLALWRRAKRFAGRATGDDEPDSEPEERRPVITPRDLPVRKTGGPRSTASPIVVARRSSRPEPVRERVQAVAAPKPRKTARPRRVASYSRLGVRRRNRPRKSVRSYRRRAAARRRYNRCRRRSAYRVNLPAGESLLKINV